MADQQNPYEAPSSELVVDHDFEEGTLLAMPNKQPFGRGVAWIGEAWGYFKQSPLNWILILLIMFALGIVLGLIPFVGSLIMNILYPVLIAGVLLGCRDLDAGKMLSVETLFAGFSHPQRNRLLVMGALYIAFSLVIVLIMAIVFFAFFGLSGGFGPGDVGDMPAPADFMQSGGGVMFVLAFLVAMLLIIPIMMAFYFAPALILFHDLEVMEALKRSFSGCLRNILPFLLFAIVMTLLAFLAAIPFFLGFLVLMPVGMISLYVCYKDIFLQQS